MRGFPHGIAKSGYTIAIDQQSCLGCGLCAKACNVQAMDLVDCDNGARRKRVEVKTDHCLGCGACISACPTVSLTLVRAGHGPGKKKDLSYRYSRRRDDLPPMSSAVSRPSLGDCSAWDDILHRRRINADTRAGLAS